VENAPLTNIKVDNNGGWNAELFLPNRPSALAVESITKLPDGTNVKSDQSLIVVSQIPESPEQTDPTHYAIFIATPGGASRIIRAPFGHAPQSNGLTLGSIDYDNAGGVIFSGHSESEGIIRILANNALVGQTGLADDGRWTLIPNASVPRGRYTLTVQRIDDTGKISASMMLPFERAKLAASQEENRAQITSTFHSDHWIISRSLYGGGEQHTVLYAPVALVP
jgi:hypothetical protein